MVESTRPDEQIIMDVKRFSVIAYLVPKYDNDPKAIKYSGVLE